MQIPWVQSPDEVRPLFQSTTDVVVVDVYDMVVFDDEGEEKDPRDGCRVYVRTRRIASKIYATTGWHIDAQPNDDLGYQPAAIFTLSGDPGEVQNLLESFLTKEPIYRRGRWINTYRPPER